MNSVAETINHIAAQWWPYVWRVGWQASVAAALILIVVKFGRRWPAPLRYWLLVIALAKFAIPPMLSAPVNLPSFTGSTSRGEGPTVGNAPSVEPISSEKSPRAQGASSTPISGGRGASETGGPVGQTLPESQPLSSSAPPSLSSLTWQGWLFLAYAIGCAAITARMAIQVRRLAAIKGRATPVTSGGLHRRFLALRGRVGMRRGAQLRVSREDIAPSAFGVVRPVVIVPSWMTEQLSSRELDTILSHELLHLRRRDSLVNWFQIILGVLWWLNPVMWLLNRSIRATREECCDDAILALKMTSGSAYCETLLHAARGLGAKRRAAAALGFADRLHPLGARFKRIMDTTLPRSAKLSTTGALLAALVASTALLGLRQAAESAESASEKTVQENGSESSGASARPRLQLRLVAQEGDEGPTEEMVVSKGTAGDASRLRVFKDVLLDGSCVESAEVTLGEGGGPRVRLSLTKAGAERFAEITAKNVGRRLAIIFEGEILVAPVIMSRISSGGIVIEGKFSQAEAEKIANAIASKGEPDVAHEAGRPRHFARLVIGKDAITFEGEETTRDDIKALLARVPDRRRTVLEIAVAADEPTPRELKELKEWARKLSREFGFEYMDYVGVHPLGSRALRSSFIGALAFDRRIPLHISVGADDEADMARTQWIQFQKNEGVIGAALRVTWTGTANALWRVTVGLGGPTNPSVKRLDRFLVTRKLIKGAPLQTGVELKYELGPFGGTWPNRFAVTLAKETEDATIVRALLDREASVMNKLKLPARITGWDGEDVATLRDAVDVLSPRADVNMFLHPYAVSSTGTALEECEVRFDPEANMTFEEILDNVTAPHGLLWTARNKAVIIADAKTMLAIVKKRDRRGAAIGQADQAIWRRLERTSGITFPGGLTTLEDIRALIAPLAGVNIFVHPFSQSPSGLPLADTPFEFRTITPDMTFEDTLSNVTALLMADWTVRNQAVIIAAPDRVSSIEKRPPREHQPASEADEDIWERLHRKCRMRLPGGENSLKDIAELISAPQLLGVEIEIDADAKRMGLPLPDLPFLFPLMTPDTTFEHLLDNATTLVDADWAVRDGKIFISTPERLDLGRQDGE